MDLIIYYLKLYVLAIVGYFTIFIPREIIGSKKKHRLWTVGYLYAKNIPFRKRVLVFVANTGILFILFILAEYFSGASIVGKVWDKIF